MSLYNPYRNFDKGMDDDYMGYQPQNTSSNQYMTGYEYAETLLFDELDEQKNEQPNKLKSPNK